MWWPVVHASFLLPETVPSIFLACRYHQGDFMVFILPGGFDYLQLIAWNTFSSLSLWNSKSHSLLITMKEIHWQQLILIPMCFSDCLKCCSCTSIIKSSLFFLLLCCQIQNLVTDTDEWSPFLPGHSLTGLILLRLSLPDSGGRGKGTASTLENSSILFSVYGVASNTIVSCSLFLLLCHKTFWRFCRVIIPAKETASELHLPTIQTFWWIVREMRKQWVEGQQKDNRAVSGILWQSLSGWCSAARCYNGWSTRKRNRLPIPGTWNGILYDKNLCKLIRN